MPGSCSGPAFFFGCHRQQVQISRDPPDRIADMFLPALPCALICWAPEVVEGNSAVSDGEHDEVHDAAGRGPLRLRRWGGFWIPTDEEEKNGNRDRCGSNPG
jgi:hypothetical protein